MHCIVDTDRTELGKCYCIHIERLEYIYRDHDTMTSWPFKRNPKLRSTELTTDTGPRPGPREPAAVELVQTNLRHLVINGVPVVIESRGLQDDPRGPHHHGHREDPEEQPVQHHRHVLPVLQDLERESV